MDVGWALEPAVFELDGDWPLVCDAAVPEADADPGSIGEGVTDPEAVIVAEPEAGARRVSVTKEHISDRKGECRERRSIFRRLEEAT